ncbi:MAG: MauE/DoxX family redox-associated membrane protein [Candidatus Zixiibacteriota bacterium]
MGERRSADLERSKSLKMNILKTILAGKYTTMLFRLALGAIFIYASIDKIAHPADFARAIFYFRILPVSLVNILAVVLPWVELFAGILLILGIFTRGSVLLINVMLIVFIVAIAYNVLRGVDIACGCFTVSPAAEKHGLSLLYRDMGMLLMGLQIYFFDRGLLSLARRNQTRSS